MGSDHTTPYRAAETEAAVERGDCIFPRCWFTEDGDLTNPVRTGWPAYCGSCGERPYPFDSEYPNA